MNIFEGARRIRTLAAFAWIIGMLIYQWSYTPFVYMTFVSTVPESPLVYTAEPCGRLDSAQLPEVSTTNGRKVSVTLCFKAVKAGDGEMLVPFKLAEKGLWWMGGPYSGEVTEYTKARSDRFKLTPADEEIANKLWWSAEFTAIKDNLAVLLIGIFVLYLSALIIGWVVRGFAGIPNGMDRRVM